MKKESKRRSSGGKETEVSRRRYELYRLAHEHLQEAYKAGFFIECVSICDSIISDRLDARLQFLSRKTSKLAPVQSLGHIIKQINKSGLETAPDIIDIYQSLAMWAEKRNAVVHQFVKVTDGDELHSGKERIAYGKKTAKEGIELARKVSNLIRKHNKWEREV